jgi:hypothetical protein
VVGNQPSIGSWDPNSASVMTWAEGDTWTFDTMFLEDTALEYKYIRRSADEVTWEEGENRLFEVATSMDSVIFMDLWGHPEFSDVKVKAEGQPAAEAMQTGVLHAPGHHALPRACWGLGLPMHCPFQTPRHSECAADPWRPVQQSSLCTFAAAEPVCNMLAAGRNLRGTRAASVSPSNPAASKPAKA